MMPEVPAAQKHLHLRVCDGYLFRSVAELGEARLWLDTLQNVNRRARMFEADAFDEALASTWYHCCLRAPIAAYRLIAMYLTRNYAGASVERWRECMRVAVRALLPKPTG